MVGVGAVFEAFLSGHLEDDDEVAVVHGPAELGYVALSEAMVNIRRTLSDALAEGVISAPTCRRLETVAKALPYQDRAYFRLFALGREVGLPAADLAALELWLPHGRVDQKREDALAMLKVMTKFERRPAPSTAHFHFENTTLWARTLADA